MKMCLLFNMDDYSVTSLAESKNVLCARLVNLLTPALVHGLKSIFEESLSLCRENNEEDKYLMTFQTFLTRIPKWNNTIIEMERARICEASSCSYLEDLITCVHIIHLKALSCIRVGQEQKKVDIDIPSVDTFVHRVYIAVARKVYINVYLFEKDIPPLEIQKHNRELEIIIKESILNTIRDSIPIEDILKAYLNATEEQEEIILNHVPEPEPSAPEPSAPEPSAPEPSAPEPSAPEEKVTTLSVGVPNKLSFSDLDDAVDIAGNKSSIVAPKTYERLDKIATDTVQRRKEEEDTSIKLGEIISLEHSDINDLNKSMEIKPPPQIHIDTLP